MYKKILIIIISYTLSGCKDRHDLINKKWYLHSSSIDGKVYVYKSCDAFIEFKEDNTYAAKGLIEENGTWSFKNGKLYLSEGGEFTITKMTKHTLELSAKNESGVIVKGIHKDECW